MRSLRPSPAVCLGTVNLWSMGVALRPNAGGLKMKTTYRDALATMFLEGVRLSGKPLTIQTVRRGFEAGYEAGRKSAERGKRRRKR